MTQQEENAYNDFMLTVSVSQMIDDYDNIMKIIPKLQESKPCVAKQYSETQPIRLFDTVTWMMFREQPMVVMSIDKRQNLLCMYKNTSGIIGIFHTAIYCFEHYHIQNCAS